MEGFLSKKMSQRKLNASVWEEEGSPFCHQTLLISSESFKDVDPCSTDSSTVGDNASHSACSCSGHHEPVTSKSMWQPAS